MKQNLKHISLCLLTAASLLSSQSVFAKAQSNKPIFKSGDKQVHLIELYSSEGCSSCPPADRWLTSLKGHSHLWKKFVPVKFHVDYWNRLGWIDRFSKSQYTKRQRDLADVWGSSSVYTPAFVLNGTEWRNRRLSQIAKTQNSVGNLTVWKTKKDSFTVEFSPASKTSKSYRIYGALLANGIVNKIKSGENAGETLVHDFTVIKLEDKKMSATGKAFRSSFQFKKPTDVKAESFSLVFWVSIDGKLQPVQATGGHFS